MIKPICYKCNKELNEFGAILLMPPDKEDNVKKYHICRSCIDKPLSHTQSKPRLVKDIPTFPKEKEIKQIIVRTGNDEDTNLGDSLFDKGYNQARFEIGNLPIPQRELNWRKLANFIYANNQKKPLVVLTMPVAESIATAIVEAYSKKEI